MPNRTPNTLQSLFESVKAGLQEANGNEVEIRIKRYYLKEEVTTAGEFIPGSWATGSVVVMMIVTDMERVPKLPDDPIVYKHYAYTKAEKPPVVMQDMKATSKGMRPNMRFASNKYVGQWCADCNGYKHRSGCNKAAATKEWISRKASTQ